jgi:hypothetical protein
MPPEGSTRSAPAAQNVDPVPQELPADSEPSTQTAPRIYHGACGKWWTGISRGHCGQCHETFTAGAFDKHQRIPGGVITCSTAKLHARQESWGDLWALPQSDYWQKRRADGPE